MGNIFFKISKNRHLFIGIFALIACSCLLSCLFTSSPNEPPLRTDILFLNVGQGDAAYIDPPGIEPFLIDTGRKWSLLAKTIPAKRKLSAIFISHADADHSGALDELLDSFQVAKVYFPSLPENNDEWNRLVQFCTVHQVEVQTLTLGDRLQLGPLQIEVLWPPQRANLEDNNRSLVLRIKDNASIFLFTGDIENASESEMSALFPNLNCDILKVAHHGSRTSSSLPFLASARPRWAILSCDSTVYGHPHRETLRDLVQFLPDSSRLLRTDREGSFHFQSNENGLQYLGAYR